MSLTCYSSKDSREHATKECNSPKCGEKDPCFKNLITTMMSLNVTVSFASYAKDQTRHALIPNIYFENVPGICLISSYTIFHSIHKGCEGASHSSFSIHGMQN